MDALGAYFATLRGSKSRAKLAAELGISEMSILRIEDRGQEPKAEVLVALVKALRANWDHVAYLLDPNRNAEEWRSRSQQVETSDERLAMLNRLIADLETDPRKLDQLIGYGARLLDEDRKRETEGR